MLSLYFLGYFIQWFLWVDILLKAGFFFILSIGLEILELILPFEFAIEITINKIGNIIVKCLGFYIGKYYNK